MIMADVLKILFMVVGTCGMAVCYWLLFEALAPEVVERARKRYVEKPIRNILLGIVLGGIPLAIGFALVQGPGVMKMMGFAIIFALILLGLMGSTGLVRHIGQRLNSPADDAQPWRRVLRGGSILSIACVLPFIGWFALIPLILISGVGAALMAIWSGRKERTSEIVASQG